MMVVLRIRDGGVRHRPWVWETLVLHGAGAHWRPVASPSPGGTGPNSFSGLAAVSAGSASDAWAVGSYQDPSTYASLSLTLHWNGTAWNTISSPSPGGTDSGD